MSPLVGVAGENAVVRKHFGDQPVVAAARAAAGSVVARLVPSGAVGSLHHQSVATHDPRWLRTATAPDGVVEALEWHDLASWPAIGVQWHPELDHTAHAVFGWLVTAARLRGVRRAPLDWWHDAMDPDKAEVVQNVVDRVSSYQDGAPEGTVEKELRSGLDEAGVELDDGDISTLTQAIEQQDGEVDVAAALG